VNYANDSKYHAASFSSRCVRYRLARQNNRTSHERVDTSFVKAAASNGGGVLFTRKDSQGRTWEVHTNSRSKADEGQVHSHEGWTAVVVVMSGAATFVTPGAAAAKTAPNVLGGQSVGSGESHRISIGDVIVVPPGAPHVYTNIEEPFRYLVVETPL
jgi:mannose-6-phosphate isomerase-like protein (cupin superfamily)